MSQTLDQFHGIDADAALTIFKSAPTPYLVLTPDFTIVDANDARLIITDTTRENTIGKNLFTVFPDNPEDRSATGVSNLRFSLETVLKTKTAHRMAIQKYDILIQTPHGMKFEERYWSPLNFPILDSHGEVKYLIHQVEDVTLEIKYKKQLDSIEAVATAIETERSRLLSVFEQAPIGICLMRGPNLIIEFANKTYRKISGEKRMLDGLPMAQAFSDIGPESLALTMNTFLTGKIKVVEDLKVTTDWDHSGKPYEKIFFVILEALIGADGKPEGVITLAHDDTENIRTRLEAKKHLQDLKKERDLRERFVATLSHDLLTPLTAAKMSAQLAVRKAEDSDSVRRFCEKIIMSLERCDQMILDLLDANRIKAGEKLPMEFSECSLKEIAFETIEELSTVHGNRFTLDAPSGSVEGLWSANGLKRIIENLCNNAIKYGSKQTKITLRIRENQSSVTLTIHNSGNVISSDDQLHLFDLHSRVSTEENAKVKGWGLGLTLVKGLTEAHGGSTTVQSTVEDGTIFTVKLPKNGIRENLNSIYDA